jgi:energy-coupling factor transporter transmembrane protein EcfT
MEKVFLRSIALPLLEETLTRSLQLAQSMDSRGYGVSRKRSRYRPAPWLARDFCFVIAAVAAATVMFAS